MLDHINSMCKKKFQMSFHRMAVTQLKKKGGKNGK